LATAASGTAAAYAPTIAQLDAAARAAGNRRDIAERIGASVFAVRRPAEVSQISANELAGHLIVGIRIVGVKFHRPMTRDEFVSEVLALVEMTRAAAPATEEVDLWASVPLDVAKGVVVSGDLAKPTSRTVFSVSVLGNESAEALRARLRAENGSGVFWDSSWTHTALRVVS
jgi:hypothetical protein